MNINNFFKKIFTYIYSGHNTNADALFKANKERHNAFKPKIGELYWYVQINGYVACSYLIISDVDAYRIIHGNCYKTKSEAKTNINKHVVEMYLGF